MFKVNNKDTRTTCFSVSVVNFEQAIAGWDRDQWHDMVHDSVLQVLKQDSPKILGGVLRILSLLYGATAKLTFTCSKSTTEILEKGVKYIQS